MKKLLILFIILISKPAFSQQYNYTNYTPNDGLPSSQVYHVIQDSKGYIWFATDNGVSRFDGYEFKNFTTENGLPNNTIFEIYEDFEGKLWFISFSGKLSYYFNDSIHLYKYNKELIESFSQAPKPIKNGFYIDSLKNVYWCDFYNDITSISRNGRVKKIANEAQLLLINNHLFINDSGSKKIDTFLISENDKVHFTGISLKNIPHWKSYKTAIKNKNEIYFATRNNLFKIKNFNGEQEKYFEGHIIWISYQNNVLWVGTSRGLKGFKNGNLKQDPDYSLLTNKNISSILVDKENSIWITTINNGVFYTPDLHIETIKNKSNNGFACIEKGAYGILFGLNNGTIGELINNQTFYISGLLFDNSMLKNTAIFSIDVNETVVITQGTSYLLKTDSVVKTKYPKYTLKKISDNSIAHEYMAMYKDSFDIIWAGTATQLLKASKDYIFTDTVSEAFPSQDIYSLLDLPNDMILIGSKNGLWNFNKKTNEFTNLGDKIQQFNVRVNALNINTEDGSIWIGTKDNGLYVYKEDTIISLSAENCFSSNFITCIYNYNNEFWIGTKGGGAYRIKKDNAANKYTSQSFLVYHGIVSNEINSIYVNDTAAFLASNRGLNVIKYREYKPNQKPPDIYINKISINNSDTLVLESYAVPFNKNSFKINLVGLAYKLGEDVRYKYRLISSAKDTNWVYTTNRDIQLSYITPGSYTFQAKAINENNIESESPVEIKIKINPPFWKTWWFISFVLLAFIIITSLFILYVNNERNRVRIEEINERNTLEKEFIENKNKLQQEIEKYRQQALSQQMNPHFIFNSLNSIQYFIYQNEKTLSNKYLTKFSRLIRMILENSQHQLIPIQDELNALQLYLELEEMRLQGKLNFSIEIDKNINSEFYTIPPLLIQPFAENAIWHGIVNKKENGLLTIKLSEKTDHFICVVEDDGIGREAAKEIQKRKQKTHKSLGANITVRRLELLNNTHTEKNKIIFTDLIKNGVPSGTKVEIKIPKFTNNTLEEI